MMYLLWLLLYIVVHVAAARLGFYINDAYPGVNTFFWPPAGISLAVLLLFGYRFLPGMFIGAVLASLSTGAPLPVALSSGVGSTVAPFIAAFIAKRFFKFSTTLRHTRDIVGLLIVGIPLSSIFLASLITFGFVRGGIIEHTAIPAIWGAIWICNVLSASIISTFILAWFTRWKLQIRNKGSIIEGVALVTSLVLLSAGMFTDIFGRHSHFAYFVFAPLVWAALRFGIREVATILFVFSVLALWSTLLGKGPVLLENVTESILYLEGFVSVVSVTSMLLAVTVAERREFEKRKDNFISMASHELRTPLTSVKMMTQVMARKNKNNVEKKYLEDMDQQLDKLTRLINEMLDLSKIQAQKLKLRKELFLLNPLLKQVAETMRVTDPSHKIVIQGKSAVKLRADKSRIEQVLINLLSNAIKYSPEANEVHVSVKQNEDTVVIEVQDFGIGIAPKNEEKVFERFFRVEKGNANTGLGLGLYISSEIVKQHNGRIWVKSQKGKGSTFSFMLPLV